MTLVLDAGALVALDRGERAMWRRLSTARARGEVPVTHAGVLGQVWRNSSGQALLARVVDGLDVRSLDGELGRAAGELLAASGSDDVIEAALVLLAEDGDDIVTSDPGDLGRLAAYSGCHVELIRP